MYLFDIFNDDRENIEEIYIGCTEYVEDINHFFNKFAGLKDLFLYCYKKQVIMVSFLKKKLGSKK